VLALIFVRLFLILLAYGGSRFFSYWVVRAAGFGPFPLQTLSPLQRHCKIILTAAFPVFRPIARATDLRFPFALFVSSLSSFFFWLLSLFSVIVGHDFLDCFFI